MMVIKSRCVLRWSNRVTRMSELAQRLLLLRNMYLEMKRKDGAALRLIAVRLISGSY